ncbi:LPS export ABC transporter periplasmic protein LptC [Chelativorans sp. YIM 93263]|uniref:LPS export ABC transporter periplasmic protein LptC n=1 Tax=Chelativorans sp. YIM 93263 TaxID=2906648 RepID=UPI0023798B3F|nr:LPS export ABC transporter periplasmic protein LptC [Chelativorans sp. YIM 93263]
MQDGLEAETAGTPIRRSERGEEAFSRAARHSRRVRVLKFVLPVVAVVASALLLGYSFLFSIGGDSVNPGSVSIESGNLVMDNPSLDGFTSANLPYHMTAARARQAIGGEDGGAILLEDISATVPIDEHNEASIRATAGTFERGNDRLKLDDSITVRTTSGITARLQSAEIDMDSGSLTTEDPVEIDLDGIQVRANKFNATGGGERLVFEDRVRVRMDPKQVRRTSAQRKENE